ncbi:MAG TPA: hypothetical protein DEP95_00420 [Candidatus Staskawiczbacteria bacterium]|nr:hypothetical protein [Candidatus Staskawiczbacteria bacterium]
MQEAKNLISNSKNIYIVSQEEPEAFACSLALFYTLKELSKNVNLIIGELPENLKFLAPSLDFVSYPKNFVISIPNRIADISQIYYEKNDNDLKIHLTLDKGIIKKDDASFYFSEPKPDLIITLGVKDYKTQLKDKMDSFGFLLDSPILNIDSGETDNKNFGKINLLSSQPIAKTTTDLIKSISDNPIKKEAVECLLTGLVICTENFKNSKVTADIFELAGSLMKQGASFKKIIENIYK